MRDKLENFLEKIKREGKFSTINNPLIYIVDRKKEQQGDVEILKEVDSSINGLSLINDTTLNVYYYVFKDNSFRHEIYNKEICVAFSKGNKYRQCECILFPYKKIESPNWILLVELKYALDFNAASRKDDAYPQHMIEQIIQTAEYLRRHDVIPVDSAIHAILSFPNVIENFNSTLFEGDIFIEDESKIDIRKSPTNNIMNRTQIAMKYKIIIHAQNTATIKSGKRLKFT